MDEAFKCKHLRCAELAVEAPHRGWSTEVFPVEVGCRGFVATSTIRLLRDFGIRGSKNVLYLHPDVLLPQHNLFLINQFIVPHAVQDGSGYNHVHGFKNVSCFLRSPRLASVRLVYEVKKETRKQ